MSSDAGCTVPFFTTVESLDPRPSAPEIEEPRVQPRDRPDSVPPDVRDLATPSKYHPPEKNMEKTITKTRRMVGRVRTRGRPWLNAWRRGRPLGFLHNESRVTVAGEPSTLSIAPWKTTSFEENYPRIDFTFAASISVRAIDRLAREARMRAARISVPVDRGERRRFDESCDRYREPPPTHINGPTPSRDGTFRSCQFSVPTTFGKE